MTAGRPDVPLVRRHLVALIRAVETLRAYRGRPVDLLRSDQAQLWVVEHGLQVFAQKALDVATHLAASAGRDVPDYAAAIDRLRDLGILAPEFAAGFRAVADFRNVVVHGYLEVDPARVHALLNERLEDFAEFARQVERHLAGLEAAPQG